MSYFNEDQRDHMDSLAKIPADLRCASGWHVIARETCDCARYHKGALTLAQRKAEESRTPDREDGE